MTPRPSPQPKGGASANPVKHIIQRTARRPRSSFIAESSRPVIRPHRRASTAMGGDRRRHPGCLHAHILNLFEEVCESGFLNVLKCQMLLPRIILGMTVIHVPHPKGGVSVNPLRNLHRVQTAGPRRLIRIHGLFDRQNVADRVAKSAGDLPRRAVAVMLARTGGRRSGRLPADFGPFAGHRRRLGQRRTSPALNCRRRAEKLVVVMVAKCSAVHSASFTTAKTSFLDATNSFSVFP